MRIRNLVSSALLRTMLVEQREQAQREVERLYAEVQQRADELAAAKEKAEQAALENARLYQAEQRRRQQAESLARAARQLSSLLTTQDVTRQILEQLQTVVPYARGGVLIEDPGGNISVVAQHGFPDDLSAEDLRRQINFGNACESISRNGELLVLDDIAEFKKWKPAEGLLPLHHSWMGVPLFARDKVIGMLSLTRSEPKAFNSDDRLTATFAAQAAIALENARLYEEITRFNEMMERMVEQRVNELSQVVVGQPAKLPVLSDLANSLPASFEAGNNAALLDNQHVIYRILADKSLGYLELLTSPWNDQRAVMAVLGTTPDGVASAGNALVVSAIRNTLKGNFAVIDGTASLVADTRIGTGAGALAAGLGLGMTVQPTLSPVSPAQAEPVQVKTGKDVIPPALAVVTALIIMVIALAVWLKRRSQKSA